MKHKESFAFFCIVVVCAAAATAGIIVRSPENTRVWQTVLDPSEPLSWPWHAGATAATLSISNELTGAVSTETMQRQEGSTHGEYSMPVSMQSGDLLFTVGLVQTAGEAVLSSDRARLAYTPGSGGGAVTVLATRRSAWKKSSPVAALAYDAVWWPGGDSAAEASLVRSLPGCAAVTNSLGGASGWGTVAVDADLPVSVSLLFDGDVFATGVLRTLSPGMMLLFQ